MQKDFNQENINPDLDQETSNLGIDLTLDSEENEVAGIDYSESAFDDLDYFNEEKPETPKASFEIEVEDKTIKPKKRAKVLDEEVELSKDIELQEPKKSAMEKAGIGKSSIGVSTLDQNKIKSIGLHDLNNNEEIEEKAEDIFGIPLEKVFEALLVVEKELGEEREEIDLTNEDEVNEYNSKLDKLEEDFTIYKYLSGEFNENIDPDSSKQVKKDTKRIKKYKKTIKKDKSDKKVELYYVDREGEERLIETLSYNDIYEKHVKYSGFNSVEEYLLHRNKESGLYTRRKVEVGGKWWKGGRIKHPMYVYRTGGMKEPSYYFDKDPEVDPRVEQIVGMAPLKEFVTEPEYKSKEEKERIVKQTKQQEAYRDYSKKVKEENKDLYDFYEDAWDHWFGDDVFAGKASVRTHTEAENFVAYTENILPPGFSIKKTGDEQALLVHNDSGRGLNIETDWTDPTDTKFGSYAYGLITDTPIKISNAKEQKDAIINFILSNSKPGIYNSLLRKVDSKLRVYNTLLETPFNPKNPSTGGFKPSAAQNAKLDQKVNAVANAWDMIKYSGDPKDMLHTTALTSTIGGGVKTVSAYKDDYERYGEDAKQFYDFFQFYMKETKSFNEKNGIEIDEREYLSYEDGGDAGELYKDSNLGRGGSVYEKAYLFAWDKMKEKYTANQEESNFEQYIEHSKKAKKVGFALFGDIQSKKKINLEIEKKRLDFQKHFANAENAPTENLRKFQALVNNDMYGEPIKGSRSNFEFSTQQAPLEEGERYFKLENDLIVPEGLYWAAMKEVGYINSQLEHASKYYEDFTEKLNELDDFNERWDIYSKNYNDFEAFLYKSGMSISTAVSNVGYAVWDLTKFVNPIWYTSKAFGGGDIIDEILVEGMIGQKKTHEAITSQLGRVSFDEKGLSIGNSMSYMFNELFATNGGNLLLAATLPGYAAMGGIFLSSYGQEKTTMLDLQEKGLVDYSDAAFYYRPLYYGLAEAAPASFGTIRLMKNFKSMAKSSSEVMGELYDNVGHHIAANLFGKNGVLGNSVTEAMEEIVTNGLQNWMNGDPFGLNADEAAVGGFLMGGGTMLTPALSTPIFKDYTNQKEIRLINESNLRVLKSRETIKKLEDLKTNIDKRLKGSKQAVAEIDGKIENEKQSIERNKNDVNEILENIKQKQQVEGTYDGAIGQHAENVRELGRIRTEVAVVLKNKNLTKKQQEQKINELRNEYAYIQNKVDIFTDLKTWGSGWAALKGNIRFTLNKERKELYNTIRTRAIDNIKKRRGSEQFFTEITEEQIDKEAQNVYEAVKMEQSEERALKFANKIGADLRIADTNEEGIEMVTDQYDQLIEAEKNNTDIKDDERQAAVEQLTKEKQKVIKLIKSGDVNGWSSKRFDNEFVFKENAVKNRMAYTYAHELTHKISRMLIASNPYAFENFGKQVENYLRLYQPAVWRKMLLQNSGLVDRSSLTFVKPDGTKQVIPIQVDEKGQQFISKENQEIIDNLPKGTTRQGQEVDYDELISSFFENVAEGRIDLNKMDGIKGVLGTLFKDAVDKASNGEIDIDFKGTLEVDNFFEALGVKEKSGIFSKFKKPKIKLKVDKKPKAKVKVKPEETKFSKTEQKQLGDSIKQLVPEGTTKAEFDSEVIGNVYLDLVAGNKLDGLIKSNLAKYGVTGDKIYGKPIDIFIEDVKLKLYEKSIQRFNPEKNDDFGGFIVNELVNYRIGDVVNDYKKLGQEARMPQYEGQDIDYADSTDPDDILDKIDEQTEEDVKIKLKEQFGEEGEVIHDKAKGLLSDKDLSKLDFKSLKGVTLSEVQEMFGISPKPGNLTRADNENAQEFIKKNWKTLLAVLPEGSTPSGTSTGIQKVLLNKFYEKNDRVKLAKTGSAAGLAEQIKRDNITKEEFLDAFDISSTDENLIDRDGRGSTSSKIKALVAQVDRMFANQAARESAMEKGEHIPSKIWEGKSEIMFSMASSDVKFSSIEKLQDLVTAETDNIIDNNLSFEDALDQADNDISKIVIKLLHDALPDIFGDPTFEKTKQLLPPEIKKRGANSLSGQLLSVALDKNIKLNKIRSGIIALLNTAKKKGIIEKEFVDELLNSDINSEALLNLFFFSYGDGDSLDARKEKRIKSETSIELSKVKEKKRKRETTNRDLIKEELPRLKKLKNGVVDSFKKKGVDIDASVKIDEKTYKKLEQKFKKVKELIDENSPAKVVENALNDYESELNKIVDEHFEKLKEPVKRNKDGKDRLKTKIKIHILGYPTKVGEKSKAYPQERLKRGYNILVDQDNKIDLLENKITSETPIALLDKNGNPKKGDQYDFKESFFSGGFIESDEDFSEIGNSKPYINDTGIVRDISNILTSEDSSKSEKISEYNNLSKEIQKANIANKKIFTHALRIQYNTLLDIYNNTEDFSKFKDGVWTGWIKGLTSNSQNMNGFKAFASLDISQIKDGMSKVYLEHMYPALRTRIDIMTTFSDGIANGKSWEDIQNDVSKIVDKNTVAVLEESTAGKVRNKLGDTTDLNYARLFAILKEIPSLYRVNSDKISETDRIAQIKEMFITKEFLETLGEKVKAINEKELSFSKVVKPDASMTNQDVLSLAATIDAVLNLARNPNTPVKKIRIFDFDDTLAQTKSNVNYVMPDGTKGKLTAEEFAKKGDVMAAKGAQWDFSEFNKVMQGKKGPLFNIAERIQRARGTEDLFVLTARAPEAALAIKEFLDSIGLNIPIENITGLGNSSPFAKSQWVIEKAAEGYNDFYFADDHIANVEAVQDALDQLTDVKARTQIAIVSDEAVVEEQNMNRSIDSPTEEGSEGLLDIRFSKKNRDLYIKQLTKRRKDLLPEEITFNVDQVFKFVDNLDVPQNKKKKFEKLALHYLANGYIILPEDGYKITTAEKIARIKKLDPFSFKNPNEILELMPDELAKNSFDPDKTESFTNKKVLDNGVVVYDVAHTDQGQKDVRLAIDRDFGKKANPWCLAVKNEKGELSWDAKQRWQSYNDNGKGAGYKIAFQNGKLTALRDGSEKQWWDRMDRPSEGIPITRKAKDGWIEHVPVKEDGTEGKVRSKTKGNKNNGRYMEMISADELMYGSSNDFELVEDITYKDGEPMDGFRKNYGSEDNFSLQEYKGGVKVKSLYDSSSEFINNDHKETIYFGDKAISVKVDKSTEEYVLNEKGERSGNVIQVIEGVDANGDRIVYKELEDTTIGGLAYPQTIYKELNGDKYLTQWDLNVNELFESVIYQTKDLTKDQLEAEYLKTNAAKVMSLEDFRSKGYGDDYLRSTIKNYKVTVGKAALDKNDKKIVIPVDEEGYSLKFSMTTRMDLDWKKTEKPGPSWQTEPSIGYRTEFKVDDKTYKINIAKLFESESLGILNEVLSRDDIFEVKGDYYEVDFAYIDENGLPRTDQTGLAGKYGGKVLSIVTNGVLEFAKENKATGLYFTSAAPKRSRIYKVLSDIFGSELGWGNKMKTDEVMNVKTDNFIVSQDIPIKKVNKERKPVRDVLKVIDKSSQTQTDLRFSKANLDKDFNKIIQESSGIEWYKEFSPVKAKVRGAKKGRYKFFLPPSAEDMLGLVYNTLGKGKIGEAQLDWYKEHLFNPYARGIENLSKDRANLMRDFKALKKALRVPKDLRKKTDSGFTKEQALRVYLWNKTGQKVPGISETDLKELVDIINSDETLKAFGDQILEVTKGDGYSKPGKNWLAGTITTDLIDLLNTTKRAKYLQEWQENVDEIYSEKNLSKLEAAYGPKYVEALRNMLARMKSGKNRIAGGNRLSNGVLNYINQGQGSIMFWNTRSALLQTISATNFINWSFNNPYKAGKAFANQPQYWKDFLYLMNSDYLVDRRNGLKINISENEIADAAKTSTNKAKAVLNYLIQKGYAPSSFMDSFAIASGGATFYRNRVNDLLSQKDAEGESIYTKEQAEEIAFKEFRDKSELSQQSSDPSKISAQQASDLGRIVLQFANTPMQYARLQKRAFQDLKNRRGNPKEHISKIIYYGVMQNIWFNFLQQAGFALGFVEMSDEEEEKKVFDIVNGTLDSLLRGIGLAGVTTSVLKNIVIDVYKRSQKDRPEYQDVWLQLLAFSPSIKSKLGKFRQAAWPFDTKKGREEIFEKGFSLDNPAWRSLAKVIEGASGLPLDRLYQKAENLAAAFDDQTETWQSVAMILGWPEWQLQTEEQKGFSRAKEDPTVYSKRQQIEVLRKYGYTDDQIKELKNEEMRAEEILKLQKETGKFYKPKTTEAEQEIISKYNKYSKEEQQSILKQQGYTDKEIYSFNTEEKRVDAIRKANKKTFKRYQPSSKHVYKAPKVVSREPIIK